MTINRRHFLGAAGAGAVGSVLAPGLARAASMTAQPGATLDDIEHVVIFMQENRSFDEYFGRMSGVIGFDDPNAIPGVFTQPGGGSLTVAGEATNSASPYTLPWHFDTTKTDAQTTGGLSHAWIAQHGAWAEGLMNGWLAAQEEQQVTMGYFDQPDIPYHWALADSFTILDGYHCSVLGPTNPNRIMLMSGTVDPEGTMGGPCVGNSENNDTLKWKTVPDLLQEAGVDWYVYQENDNYGDNMLPLFTSFQDTTTDLYRRGNSFIPSTSLLGEATAARIKADVLAGKLPQVSYIIGAAETTEHPDYSPGRGAQFIDQILEALTADPAVWAKTLLILNYDENDGHFDHVLPPTAPVGTAGEYLSPQLALQTGDADGVPGPVGLGFRVPCILISPFTVGPLVCSDVFDHTSVIQFLETKFGIHCPNISAWRRSTVGNLVSAINFAATPAQFTAVLPDGDALAAAAQTESSNAYPEPPSPQVMPHQYATPVRGRPSGLVASTPPPALPDASLPIVLPAVAAAAAGLVALRTRRQRSSEAPAPEAEPVG